MAHNQPVMLQGRSRRTKIVATLGPATDGQERELLERGVDVVRLNFSHGTPAEHERRCAAVRAAARELSCQVAVMQDLQGPKIRVGSLMGGGPIALEDGQTLRITTEPITGDAQRISSTYPKLAQDVRPGDHLLLDDGRLRLTVTCISGAEIVTRVDRGGLLGEHKGMNLPGVDVSEAALTEADHVNLEFGLHQLGVDYVALSFVRSADDVRQARKAIRSLGRDTPVIAKLEKPEAIQHLEAITRASDGLMVARGDLGVELAPEDVPMLQKRIIQRANAEGIPVITATQMLESMIEADSPTRAEAADVANAVWDGTGAVMLSGETAVGRHPGRVVEMMDRIVRSAEAAATEPGRHYPPSGRRFGRQAAAIAHAARVLAEDLGAAAILGHTRTGKTAHLLSSGRPAVPIYAFSASREVCRQLALWWGVAPVHLSLASDLEANVAGMKRALLSTGRIAESDLLVITGSQPLKRGVHTNFVRFELAGRR